MLKKRTKRTSIGPTVRRTTNAIIFACAASVMLPAWRTFAEQPTTNLTPSTTPVAEESISQKIKSALLNRGNVDSLAQELQASDSKDPQVLDAIVQVATEQGNLQDAINAMNTLFQMKPQEANSLQELALLQEQTGSTIAAQSTLRQAISIANDLQLQGQLKLRLALLTFDTGEPADGVSILDEAVKANATLSVKAGVIAYLEGQYVAATSYFDKVGIEASPSVMLMSGNAALRAGNLAGAKNAFETAFKSAVHSQDKFYAQERLIATARQSEQIQQLADQWLTQQDLPQEKVLGLAIMLRESGRVHDLIHWWQQLAENPRYAAFVLSPRFVNEVIGASQDAGLAQDAESVARELLARTPDNQQSLTVLLRVLLNEQKTTDADALLKSRIAAASDSPQDLDSLGRLARSFGRDEAAIQAAHTLENLGSDNAVAGMLLESSVLLKQGEIDQGITLLHNAANTGRNDPVALGQVASALEAANRESEAIKLLQASIQQVPDEVVMERLSAMLIEEHRNAEAAAILQTLRHSASSSALVRQATQQLLEIALADGSLDNLVGAARAAYDAGTADESDITLLVDGYVRLNNIQAAADVLRGAKFLDQKSRLNRLAVLFLRLHKLPEAEAVLRELVDADPQNSVGTLEQLASLEIDRKKPQAAAAVIAELSQRLNDGGSASNELLGGIFDRLDRPAAASVCYRKALAANSGDADCWLLWATAENKTGKRNQAIGRLQQLCNNAPNDSILAIAVDGLLNLGASSPALESARRDAILQVSAQPDKTNLYHVISDLSDELKEPIFGQRSTEASLAVSYEERPQRLRELMEAAMDRGLVEQASAYGRSILALDDDFPPQLFLELGEQLLTNDRPKDASQAFDRAREVSSDAYVAPRAADLFEKYGYPDRALQALSSLAGRKSDDFSIRLDIGRLDELAGKASAAFEQYMAAITIVTREWLAQTKPDSAVDLSAIVNQPSFETLLKGAAATAQTPQQQADLTSALELRVDQLIEKLPSDGRVPGSVSRTLNLIRNTFFALDRVDVADRIDQKMIDRFPAEDSLKSYAVSQRVIHGFYPSARRLAINYGLVNLLPAPLQISSLEVSADDLPATSRPASVAVIDNPDEAAIILPQLVMTGKLEDARRLLNSISITPPKNMAETIPVLIESSVALGEDQATQKWAMLWLNSALSQKAPVSAASAARANIRQAEHAVYGSMRPPAEQPEAVISVVWPVLSKESRDQLLSKLMQIAGSDPRTPASGQASVLVLRLASVNGTTPPGILDIALRLAAQPMAIPNLLNASTAGSASLIDLLPQSDRAAFVQQAIEQMPMERRLMFLERVVSQSIEPFDSATDTAIITAINSLQGKQSQNFSNWDPGDAHQAIMPALAEAIVRNTEFDAPEARNIHSLVIAASLFKRCGSDRAQDVALQAIELLRGPKILRAEKVLANSPGVVALDSSPQLMLSAPFSKAQLDDVAAYQLFRNAVAVLSADARGTLLVSLKNQASDTSASATDQAWRSDMIAIVLESLGEPDEALAAYRSAFVMVPENHSVRLAYVSRLMMDGRSAEIVNKFYIRQPINDPVIRKAVEGALYDLFRSREIQPAPMRVGVSVLPDPPNVDLMTPLAKRDWEKLAQRFRTLLLWWRVNPGQPRKITEPSEGGLENQDDAKTFSHLNIWPGTIDDLFAEFRCVSPHTTDADWLASLLTHSADDSPAGLVVRDSIIQYLKSRKNSGSFGSNDRLLLSQLSILPGVRIPASLAGELWNLPMDSPSGDCKQLLACLKAQNDPMATHVERWVAACSTVNQSQDTRNADSNYNPPPPLGFIDDIAMAKAMEALIDSNQADEAEKELLKLRVSGRVSSADVQCGLVWARVAAERGDLPLFRSRLTAVMESQTWGNEDTRLPLDICRSVLSKLAVADRSDALARAACDVVEQTMAQWPGKRDFTRELTRVGIWAYSNGARDASAKLLRTSIRLGMHGTGEDQIWIADLANKLGQSDVAMKIQSHLLEERCLPGLWIAPLLQSMQKSGDVDAATKLSSDAAAYCSEPNLQAMAHALELKKASANHATAFR